MTTNYHSLDLRDDRGREVGAIASIRELDDGTANVCVQPARARQPFGAGLQPVNVAADRVDAEVNRRLAGMRKRYARKFGAAS